MLLQILLPCMLVISLFAIAGIFEIFDKRPVSQHKLEEARQQMAEVKEKETFSLNRPRFLELHHHQNDDPSHSVSLDEELSRPVVVPGGTGSGAAGTSPGVRAQS